MIDYQDKSALAGADHQVNSALAGINAQSFNSSSSSRKKSLPSKLSPSSTDNKKKVQCHECGFTCTSYAQLKVHHRIHTGDKPYKCPECNYASTRNPNLQRHIASMHPGHASSTILKRGRPVNNMVNGGGQPSFSLSGGRKPGRQLVDSLSTGHVKSSLSEIRARELMLAEDALPYDTRRSHLILPASQVLNSLPSHISFTQQQKSLSSLTESVLQPDATVNQDLTRKIMDGGLGLASRLIHPASQVLALPSHIPLMQQEESSSSYDEHNSVIEEPILIGDHPIAEENSAPAPEHIETRPEHGRPKMSQVGPVGEPFIAKNDHQILSNNTRSILNDTLNNTQQQPAPLVVMPTSATHSRSVSPEIIPIDSPTESVNRNNDEQEPRFTCIVDDNFTMTGHQLGRSYTTSNGSSIISAAPTSTTPHQSILNSVLTSPLAGTTHTKVNPQQPLVLEIENSSIGLYLHLDLSKYLCEKARHLLSQHTHECEGVCRANFPVHTSNATSVPAAHIETDPPVVTSVQAETAIPTETAPLITSATVMMDTNLQQQSFLPTPTPIHNTNRVATISRAPPMADNPTRAFPTAILAVPQSQPSDDENRGLHSQNDFPNERSPEDISTDINSSKNITSEVGQIMNVIPPSSISTLEPCSHQTNNGSLAQPHVHHKRKHNPIYNSIVKPDPQVDNSLIFQRWPSLKQYMQVRSLAGNQREYSCYKCGKQFTQMHQLKVHVKNHIKRYNCQQCHYSTHRMANLRRHQLTHRKINELMCHVCRSVLPNKRAYTMHVLFAHKKQKKGKDFEQWRKQFGGHISAAIASKYPRPADHKGDVTNLSGGSTMEENLNVKPFQDTDQEMKTEAGGDDDSPSYNDVIIKKEVQVDDNLEEWNRGSEDGQDEQTDDGDSRVMPVNNMKSTDDATINEESPSTEDTTINEESPSTEDDVINTEQQTTVDVIIKKETLCDDDNAIIQEEMPTEDKSEHVIGSSATTDTAGVDGEQPITNAVS